MAFMFGWIYFLVLARVANGMTKSEACGFVGAKLMKVTGSFCLANKCNANGPGTQVKMFEHHANLSCESAIGMAKAVLAELAGTEQPNKRRRMEPFSVDTVVATLETVIVPSLEQFLYRGVFHEELVGAMADVHGSLMRGAAVWTTFRREGQMRLVGASRRIETLTADIFRKALYTVDTHAVLSHTLGPIANFFFDLCSVTQKCHPRSDVQPLMQTMAVHGSVTYRARHAEEWNEYSSPHASESPVWALNVSTAIATLHKAIALRVVVPQSVRARIEPLFEFLTGKVTASPTTTRLMEDQVRTDLCRPPDRLALGVLIQFPSPFNTKQQRLQTSAVLIPLLRLCRSVAPVFSASMLLGKTHLQHYRESSNVTLPDDPMLASIFFARPAILWVGTVTGSVARANEMLDDFVAKRSPLVATENGPRLIFRPERMPRGFGDLGNSFQEIVVQFGRAVALVLRMNGSVARLGFTSHFVNLLHGMQLGDEPNETAEAMYYFNRGAVDVLGALGFTVFDLVQLHGHFGTLGPASR